VYWFHIIQAYDNVLSLSSPLPYSVPHCDIRTRTIYDDPMNELKFEMVLNGKMTKVVSKQDNIVWRRAEKRDDCPIASLGVKV
jgi:hypothetical protein